MPVEIGKLINLQGLHLSNNKLTCSKLPSRDRKTY